jgi:hypothetical protein
MSALPAKADIPLVELNVRLRFHRDAKRQCRGSVLARKSVSRIGGGADLTDRPASPEVKAPKTSRPGTGDLKTPVRGLAEVTEMVGGRYWTRTSDPCDVNTVLYQLSALPLLEEDRQISCLCRLHNPSNLSKTAPGLSPAVTQL